MGLIERNEASDTLGLHIGERRDLLSLRRSEESWQAFRESVIA
jgi:hypothetical protein